MTPNEFWTKLDEFNDKNGIGMRRSIRFLTNVYHLTLIKLDDMRKVLTLDIPSEDIVNEEKNENTLKFIMNKATEVLGLNA